MQAQRLLLAEIMQHTQLRKRCCDRIIFTETRDRRAGCSMRHQSAVCLLRALGSLKRGSVMHIRQCQMIQQPTKLQSHFLTSLCAISQWALEPTNHFEPPMLMRLNCAVGLFYPQVGQLANSTVAFWELSRSWLPNVLCCMLLRMHQFPPRNSLFFSLKRTESF